MRFFYFFLTTIFLFQPYFGSEVLTSKSTPEYAHKLRLRFPTASVSSFRFMVFGDTQNPLPGSSQNDIQRQAIFKQLNASLTDSVDGTNFVFHTGDFVDVGNEEVLWEKYFDTIFWNRLSKKQKTRFFPAPGNHEYKPYLFSTPYDHLKDYFKRFNHIDLNRYYFFEYANSFFIIMDSGGNGMRKVLFGESWENDFEAQMRWLEDTVLPYIEQTSEEDAPDNIFIFFHKPAYATPVYLRNEDSGSILAMLDDFNKKHKNHYKIISFSGHIHTFSHIVTDFNQDGSVIDQLTYGGGGGTQRGREYYQHVKKTKNLDLYRKTKYDEKTKNGADRNRLFDQVRFDNEIFGYLDVMVKDSIVVKMYKYDKATQSFYNDYQFQK